MAESRSRANLLVTVALVLVFALVAWLLPPAAKGHTGSNAGFWGPEFGCSWQGNHVHFGFDIAKGETERGSGCDRARVSMRFLNDATNNYVTNTVTTTGWVATIERSTTILVYTDHAARSTSLGVFFSERLYH